jgi:putative ABC transport system permease protein
MTDGAYIPIGVGQLALSAVLILVNVGLSLALRLGLARGLVVASLRMSAQLLLIGLVLDWVFALEQPLPILAIALVMTALASVAAVRRTKRRFARRLLGQPGVGPRRLVPGDRLRAARRDPGRALASTPST